MSAVRLSTRTTIAGLVAIACALPIAVADLRLFLACWLAAWLFVTGAMLGAMCDVWMWRLSGGDWGRVLHAPALAMARRMPLAIVAFVPIAFGLADLYPWAAGGDAWTAHFSDPRFPRAWLSGPAFAVRMVICAAIWWWLSTPATLASKGRCAVALVAWALSGTVVAVDLLMSLVPAWYSTAFGLVVLSAQALAGTALAVAVRAWRTPERLARRTGKRSPPVARDLGNLLLTWVMSWAYLAFMEFLIIWSENLPNEVRFYVPRVQGGWGVLAWCLVGLGFFLPLVMLLMRGIKDRPGRLLALALFIVATRVLNAAWLVLPSVAPHAVLAWIGVPLLTLGLGLVLLVPASPPRAFAADDAPPAPEPASRPPRELRHGVA
jgi:hypothetical protein